MRLNKYLLHSLFLVLINSCFFLPKPEVEVCFPSLPPSNPCIIESWVVEYPDASKDGKLVFATSEATESVFKINILRGNNLPVFGYPVFLVKTNTEMIRFKGNFPAAAVYPADLSGRLLELSWEDGFACSLLKSSLLNSEIISGFDTIRFRESIKEEAANLTCGPWVLDERSILSRLAYGVFRESSIQQDETMSFSIPVSGGTFYSDNCLYPVAESVQIAGQEIIEVVIPKKRKTTFINNEKGEVVECYFCEDYWCYINNYTNYSLSGR